MRVTQPAGERGSLKWMQRAIAERWDTVEGPLRDRLDGKAVEWRSPLASDGYAEYRDGSFLGRLGLGHLTSRLRAFWPVRGPQWDALAQTASGQVALVEAKAHVGELCSPGTAAGIASRARIAARMSEVAGALGSRHGDRWPDQFYQYANRLAHLWFLRDAGVDAILVLVGFLDDREMRGPAQRETWDAVYKVADHVLGLPAGHALSGFVLHLHPSVAGHD